MSVRSREEILESLRTRFGESTDDDSIAFIEDITDTLTDLETRANGDGTDWKEKYETNDAEWRKKYTERFFNGEPLPKEEPKEEPKTFSDLFKESE